MAEADYRMITDATGQTLGKDSSLQEIKAAILGLPNATQAAADAANAAAANANSIASKLVAPAFDQQTANPAGAYVVYDGDLYLLPEGHGANVSWAGTEKIKAPIGNEVRDCKNLILSNNGELNIGTLIADTYIQSSDGAAAPYAGTSATDYIYTCGADKLIVKIASTNPYNENAFYKEDKTFISSFGLVAGTQEITVPAGAKYVRFSNITANMETLSVAINPASRLYNTTRLAKIGAAFAFPNSDNVPEFTKNGTTISFYSAGLIGVQYDTDLETFNSRYITNMSGAVSVPHDSWCIWNIDTNAVQVISDTDLKKIGDVKYCPLFYNSNGNVRGLFEKYVINNKFDTVGKLNWKSNGIVAPYGTDSITFEITGTTIEFSCNRYVIYNDSNYSWRMCDMSGSPTVTVPHDYFAIYNNTANEIQVKTLEQLQAISDRMYYVLFYNSKGKLCGPFEMYYNGHKCDQLQEEIAGTAASYPSYYDDHVKSKLATVNTKLAALTAGDAFVFITDIHYPNNEMHSPALVKDACNKTGINMVLLNGDYINRETVKTDALIKANKICSLYEYPGVITYRVVGNHEFNNPGNSQDPEYLANELSAAELRFAIMNPNRGRIVKDPDSLSYYFDNEEQKIRYFVGAVTKADGMVAESIRWIAGQVESVPNDYSVVIFQHAVLSYSGNTVHVINEHFEGILNAMKAKSSYNYLGTTFDYTGKTFEFIACFCGDYHLDMDYSTTDGAKIIATTCDATLQEGSLARTTGTYAEQAFDVVVINKTTKKINMTRIGAGSDREFSY